MASPKGLQAIVDVFDDHRMLYSYDFFARYSVNWRGRHLCSVGNHNEVLYLW